MQTEIGVLSKTEENPFFHSKYLDINGILAQLLPLLAKHELTVIQPLSNVEGRPAIQTRVTDSEGKTICQDTITLPDLQDPQKMGSAITYYRRYALQSLFLLQAQDDDGEKAKPTPPSKTEKLSPDEAYQKAHNALENATTLAELNTVRDQITKSKILTADKKQTLFDLQAKLAMNYDPTK